MTNGQKAYREKLRDPHWQRRKAEICERDGWACTDCGCDTKNLQVHHKKYITGRSPWEYDDEDLTTLCEDCHQIISQPPTEETVSWETISAELETPEFQAYLKEQKHMTYDQINEIREDIINDHEMSEEDKLEGLASCDRWQSERREFDEENAKQRQADCENSLFNDFVIPKKRIQTNAEKHTGAAGAIKITALNKIRKQYSDQKKQIA